MGRLHNGAIVAYTSPMEDCLFCKIIAGSIPAEKVYEDEHFVAFLDIKPVNLGHTLLVPKEHSRNIFDTSDELLREAGPVLKKLSAAVKDATKADGITIGWNNEPAGGQLVFHTHLHVMPRFTNDGHVHWKGRTDLTAADFSSTASSIRSELKK